MTPHAPLISHAPEFALERLIFFSDAVFAIAITLLIIEVHPPALSTYATDAEWDRALLGLLPAMLGFVMSFLVIGAFWAAHHATLSLVGHYRPRLMWPNLALLMAVAFLPLPTALISNGSIAHVPFIVYSASLFAVALMKMWLTHVALQPDVIRATVSPIRLASERRRMWTMPIITAITLALAFIAPGWNMLVMLLLPLVRRVPALRLRD